jgi:hypothetical protein
MIGFVYKWFNTKTKMSYIGSHQGDINDGYIGGGVYFKRAYNKNPNHFIREILYVGEYFRELEEFILHSLDAENDQKMYNLKNYALGGKIKLTEEGRKKLSESKKGSNNPNYGKPAINKGKPRSLETKIKISEKNKGLKRDKLSYCKYLFSTDGGTSYLPAELVYSILGYKEPSTLLSFASGRKRNNKLANLILAEKLIIKKNEK